MQKQDTIQKRKHRHISWPGKVSPLLFHPKGNHDNRSQAISSCISGYGNPVTKITADPDMYTPVRTSILYKTKPTTLLSQLVAQAQSY